MAEKGFPMSVRSGLMALLAEGEKYGAQLRTEFEARTGGTWPLNVGQVYTTLDRLVRDGVVESAGEQDADGRIAYRLTAAGHRELGAWWETPVDRTSTPRDELTIKLALAVTARGVDVQHVVQTQRTATLRHLHDLTRLKRESLGRPEGQPRTARGGRRLRARRRHRTGRRGRQRPGVAARPGEPRLRRRGGGPMARPRRDDARPPTRAHGIRRLSHDPRGGHGVRHLDDQPHRDPARAGRRRQHQPRGRPLMSTAPHVVISDVTRVHGAGETAVTALAGVSLEIHPGELVAVMGPSGSGKSTLLNVAGGLDRPTSGTVAIGGDTLTDLGPRDLAKLRRRRMGFVFQDYNLIPSLTAAENVALPLELDGTRARQARRQARHTLDLMGLMDLSDRYPDQMSGGQQQRVAIARALVGSRRFVLADEPTGALDSHTGEEVLRVLRDRCDEGVAGLLVTHEARHAAWADRVVFLRDGVVVDTTGHRESPEDLLAAGEAAR